MFSLTRAVQLASLLALPAACQSPQPYPPPSPASYVSCLPKKTQQLLTESMDWMDGFYDPSAGYLYDLGAASALGHETRSSAWYSIGLLARNNGSDVEEAMKIITNIIAGQFKDPADQW